MADPFVLRYNGKYYLYCTNPLIDCWSSFDLCHWQPEGPVIDENEFPGLVPFAPEVVFWNGSFYMYTSPHGLGHYILKSDCPTGPFHKITENIGHSIDFSVFIDDDGRWYAYWADKRGILGCRMTSPTEFGEPVLIGASMHGWTEGPFVVKKDRKYHLTYTGNHYLSKGYRINMAIADRPLGPFVDNAYNPLIVRTGGDVTGLGHSSTVLGPDLCTHYIIYHNINADATRDMDMDAILLRPKADYVLGPTIHPRSVPAMPVWSDRIENGVCNDWNVQCGIWEQSTETRCAKGKFCAIYKCSLPQSGVAEFHLAAGSMTQRYGLLFQNENRTCRLEWDHSLDSLRFSEEERSAASFALWDDYNHEVLHCVRIEFDPAQMTVYLDGLLVMQIDSIIGGMRCGYFSEDGLLVGRTSISDRSRVSPAHPIPGRIPANERVLIEIPECGSYQIFCVQERGFAGSIRLDGVEQRFDVGEKDSHIVCAELTEGIHSIETHDLCAAELVVEKKETGDILPVTVENFGPYDKVCGKERCSDIDLDVTLTVRPQGGEWQAGVLLRAAELADGGEGADKVLGTNFLIGYRVCLAGGKLQLWKHRYDEQLLQEYSLPAEQNSITFCVSLNQDRIDVDWNGKNVIHYQDPAAILSGFYGFHTRSCEITAGSLAMCRST